MPAYTHRFRPSGSHSAPLSQFPCWRPSYTLPVLFHCRCVALTARRTALLTSLRFAVLQAPCQYYYYYFSVALIIWSTSSDDFDRIVPETLTGPRSATLRVLWIHLGSLPFRIVLVYLPSHPHASLNPSVSSLLAPVTLTPGVSVFWRPLPVSRAGTSSLIC